MGLAALYGLSVLELHLKLSKRNTFEFDSSSHFTEYEEAQEGISASVLSLLNILLPNVAYCAFGSTYFAATADISRRYLKSVKIGVDTLMGSPYSSGDVGIPTKTSSHRAIEEAYVWVLRGKAFIAMGNKNSFVDVVTSHESLYITNYR
jgi:hypothetical protein